ncbi:MAG: hypothetical protein KF729_26605 [Sandaracinaceae bacterium]|nr:hypothetical protein [Sandaracinaceae bacterium]
MGWSSGVRGSGGAAGWVWLASAVGLAVGIGGCDGSEPSPSSSLVSVPATLCVGASSEVTVTAMGPLSAIEVVVDGVRTTLPAVANGASRTDRVPFACASAGPISWTVTDRLSPEASAGMSGGTVECVLCPDAGLPPGLDAGPPVGTEYHYVCVEDQSDEAEAPNGVSIDAIQDYTGDEDAYAAESTCDFGPRADPGRVSCADASGEKTFCSGDTGYVTLGGAGGWVCGRFVVPIANGHILTPVGCTAGERLPVRLTICTEPDPSSGSCRPCPIGEASTFCRVEGL